MILLLKSSLPTHPLDLCNLSGGVIANTTVATEKDEDDDQVGTVIAFGMNVVGRMSPP